jgi:hypothetical protein
MIWIMIAPHQVGLAVKIPQAAMDVAAIAR